MATEDVFYGGCPPVQVNATQCGSVTITVRFIKESSKKPDLIEPRPKPPKFSRPLIVNAEWW
jgi:hypothetical protein